MSIFDSFPFRPTRVSTAVGQELAPEKAGIYSFQFDSMPIRILTDEEGTPWFVAKDVAETLGYKDTDAAVRTHCKKAKSLKDMDPAFHRVSMNQQLSLDPKTKLIPESDVYRLTMRSALESAGRFQDWVTEEVLPQIRKTGAYIPQHISQLPTAMELIHGMSGVVIQLERRVDILETEHAELEARQTKLETFSLTPPPVRKARSTETRELTAGYLTPIGLAERFWLQSSQHVNLLLEAAGLQAKKEYNRWGKTYRTWIPTEAGAPHCIRRHGFTGSIQWDPDFIVQALSVQAH